MDRKPGATPQATVNIALIEEKAESNAAAGESQKPWEVDLAVEVAFFPALALPKFMLWQNPDGPNER